MLLLGEGGGTKGHERDHFRVQAIKGRRVISSYANIQGDRQIMVNFSHLLAPIDVRGRVPVSLEDPCQLLTESDQIRFDSNLTVDRANLNIR